MTANGHGVSLGADKKCFKNGGGRGCTTPNI